MENLAGLARVAYETAGLSEFRADNDAAERSYRDSTEGMSDAAIKLELAQERLRRSLAKGPSASRESARALLSVRQAERELASQSDRTTRELEQQQRALGRLSRGAIAGSGVFGGLGRSVAFASGTFLGGAGLLYALRSTLQAGREAEASQGRVAVAVRNAGIEYGRYRDQIDRTITKQSQLSAFDDEDLADSFAKVVIRTRDVGKALDAVSTITDIARGRQISLEAATQLWIKASLNQAGQLRRVGIEVGKNTTAQQLLNKLTAAYAGQAERYGREGAGAQERLSVAIENTEETISKGLLPTVNHLSNEVADWLGKTENQERIQRDVNEVVKTGTGIVKGLAAGIRLAHDATAPLVKALGGVERAVELAFIAGVVAKVRRAALAFGPLQLASRSTSAKGVADATAFGRAWDLATRPRTMVVTTTSTGVPTTGVPTSPGVPAGPGTPGRPSLPGTTGTRGQGLVGIAAILAGVFGLQALTQPPSLAQQQRKVADLSRVDPRRAFEAAQSMAAAYGTNLADLLENNPLLAKYGKPLPPSGAGATSIVAPGETNRAAIANRPTGRPRGGRGSGTTVPTPRTLLDIQTDLARARTTATTADDVRFLTEERDRFRQQIAALESRKSLTVKQKQELQRLYGELGSAQSELDGIAADREQAIDDSREARRRKRAAEARKRAAALRKAQAADLKERLDEAKSLSIGARKQLEARFPIGEKTLERIDPSKLDDGKVTRDELRQELGQIFRDFMQWQVDLLKNGSNVAGGNLSNGVMEQLMMSGNLERVRQTRALERIATGRGPTRPLDEAVMGW